MQKKHSLLLGAHMSISGGLSTAYDRGQETGCTAMQIFTKSNRQWAAKKITDQEAHQFIERGKQSPIKFVMAHATYLINIGAAEPATAKKSVAALKNELERCHQLGIQYLVLHPGSHTGSGEAACLQRISDNLNEVLQATPSTTSILLETMAGQGSSTCYIFEHLAHIRATSEHKKRVGVCVDTCHIFVAGYDFTTAAGYKKVWDEFDAVIGLENLKAIHLNDSKKGLASKVDRHEHITKGLIGHAAFELIMNDERFFDIPKILETPKEDDEVKIDRENLALLRAMITNKNKKLLAIE
jgi:deoxyribonuclease-4